MAFVGDLLRSPLLWKNHRVWLLAELSWVVAFVVCVVGNWVVYDVEGSVGFWWGLGLVLCGGMVLYCESNRRTFKSLEALSK